MRFLHILSANNPISEKILIAYLNKQNPPRLAFLRCELEALDCGPVYHHNYAAENPATGESIWALLFMR